MKRLDAVFLVAWIFVPPLILLSLKGGAFMAVILYFVIPSIYFSYRIPQEIPKALVGALLTIPFVAVLDYLALFNKAWEVSSIFTFRFLGLIPVEDFFYTFWAFYVLQIAFRYFFPSVSTRKINWKRTGTFLVFTTVACVVFALLYLSESPFLTIPYYYACILFIVFIVPSVWLFALYPAYRKPGFRMMLYLFPLMFLYELIALKLGYWWFPSNQYFGMINIVGQHFPFEEFLMWIVFFSPAALAFSEYTQGFGFRQAKR